RQRVEDGVGFGEYVAVALARRPVDDIAVCSTIASVRAFGLRDEAGLLIDPFLRKLGGQRLVLVTNRLFAAGLGPRVMGCENCEQRPLGRPRAVVLEEVE